jgi:hypothetical protein
MKTFSTQQPFMPEELEAWALEDFGDLPLPRKALTAASLEAFRGRGGPVILEQHLLESLFNPHIGEPS